MLIILEMAVVDTPKAIIQKEDVTLVKLDLMLSIYLISALRSYTNTMENTVT